MRLAIATCRELPEPDPDEQMTLDAMRAAGFDASMLAWNGDESPEGFDAVVLRSTWDYYLSPDEFRSWLLRADTCSRLFNPFAVVLSNLHKSYLFALESRGVPTVPTVMVPEGTSFDLGGIDGRNGLVVKPAVGASSWKTRVFQPDALVRVHGYVQELAQDMDVLVQPYLLSVESGGEKSLVWIDGEFTHKIVKRPRFEGADESVSAAEPLTAREREVGGSAVSAYMDWIAGEQPLYARVDVMETDDGRSVVSEVEMTEPSLYFVQEPRALDRFVAGIRARLA